MNERDQELLDKQLWGASERPQSAVVIIGFVMIFLVGLGIGEMLSKARHANPVMANINFSSPNTDAPQ